MPFPIPAALSHSPFALGLQSPSWRRDWRSLLLAVLFVYAASLGMRLYDAPDWDNPIYRIGNERVMATPDAYHWLAGAKGSGRAAGTMPARFAAGLGQVLNLPLDALGFWSPALVASLVAPATLLWAWTLGGQAGLAAGLVAGLLAALAPSYYYRTRLGYYDTDMATLLLPLCVAWGLALGLGPFLKQREDVECTHPAICAATQLRCYLVMAGTGLAARLLAPWHELLGVFHLALFFLAFFLALVCAARGNKGRAAFAVALFGLCALLPWWGTVFAVVLIGAVCFGHLPRIQARAGMVRALFGLGLTLVAVALFFSDFGRTGASFLHRAASKIISDPAATAPNDRGPAMAYPEMSQTIEEAQRAGLEELLTSLHPWVGVVLTGLAGFFLVVWLRPEALLLAPLLLLGLAAFRLGVRTVMFASPAMALGFALPFAWYLSGVWREAPWRRWAITLLSLAAGAILAAPLASRYSGLALTPVLHAAHGQALVALGRITPASSRVWTWWDFGYAVQYYADRTPFADGGNQGAEYVYSVGMVLATNDPAVANQLIHFTGLHHYSPWNHWNQFSASEHEAYLADLKHAGHRYSAPHPQYLVLSSDALQLAPRILEFGAWNTLTRTSTPPYSATLREDPEIDYDSGRLIMDNVAQADKPVSIDLDGVYKAAGGVVETYAYNQRSGLRLLFVPDAEVRLVLDARAYDSLLVQLLICPPHDPRYAAWFRLVYDNAPYVRIYEVL